jgi:geranylgeranyl reductase family protein
VEEYDVAVVGAGPAGSSAARAAADAGARVVLLDRAEFPRYKTCGGGLIGPGAVALPDGAPVRMSVTRASFTLCGDQHRERAAEEPFLTMTTRAELDQWLLDRARGAGAEVRAPCRVGDVADGPEHVVLQTDHGPIRADYVIAADGTSSRIARDIGVRLARVDLGLEVELDSGSRASEWDERIHLDWGPLPGSYAWVFPKGDSLTVGVIAERGRPETTKAYLLAFLRAQGLDRQRVLHDSGHLTRCRAAGSPLGRGRILLAGDAAGLLEPWTREGISFAVRSGALAGAIAARATENLQAAYAAGIGYQLVPEMEAGEACRVAFERRPQAFHALLAGTRVGWRSFERVVRGDTTLARAMRHPSVRLGLRALSSGLLRPAPRTPRPPG